MMGARLRSKCASLAKSSAKNSQSIERSGLIFIVVLGKAAGASFEIIEDNDLMEPPDG